MRQDVKMTQIMPGRPCAPCRKRTCNNAEELQAEMRLPAAYFCGRLYSVRMHYRPLTSPDGKDGTAMPAAGLRIPAGGRDWPLPATVLLRRSGLRASPSCLARMPFLPAQRRQTNLQNPTGLAWKKRAWSLSPNCLQLASPPMDVRKRIQASCRDRQPRPGLRVAGLPPQVPAVYPLP